MVFVSDQKLQLFVRDSHENGIIVGVSLVGGLFVWLLLKRKRNNGKGKKRPTEFEDFGLAESDFPQQQGRPTTMMASPTLPRLNDQGNYYAGGGGPHQAYYDNPAVQQQQQQAYYYADQQQQPPVGYGGYDGYYYDTSTAVSSTPPPAGQYYAKPDTADGAKPHLHH